MWKINDGKYWIKNDLKDILIRMDDWSKNMNFEKLFSKVRGRLD